MSRRLSGTMPTPPTGTPGPGPGPHDMAADPAPPPAEQLFFTRAEKKRIQFRLLAGSAVFQAVALALVIAVNVGGVREVNGHVFAEDAYIFTWSKWYVVETATDTLALLYTFHFYLHALCVRHASGAECLYRQAGNSFDSTRLLNRVQGHFDEIYGPSRLFFDVTTVDTPGYYNRFTVLPFVLLTLGCVAASAAWTVLLLKGIFTPRFQRRIWVCTVVALIAAGILLIAAAAAVTLNVPHVHREIDFHYEYSGPDQVHSGWSFVAALWSAAVSQCLAGIVHWVLVAVKRSVDRDLGPASPPSYEGSDSEGDDEDDGLPIYARYDPLGRPPSIGALSPQHAEESIEMLMLGRNGSSSPRNSSDVDVAAQRHAQPPGYHQ